MDALKKDVCIKLILALQMTLSDDAAGDLQIFGTLFSCILIFFEKSLILVFSSYLVHFW